MIRLLRWLGGSATWITALTPVSYDGSAVWKLTAIWAWVALGLFGAAWLVGHVKITWRP